MHLILSNYMDDNFNKGNKKHIYESNIQEIVLYGGEARPLTDKIRGKVKTLELIFKEEVFKLP